MNSFSVLILTDEFDTHADVVIEAIEARGGTCFRLNLNTEALQKTSISFVDDQWIVTTSNGRFLSTGTAVIWARRLTVSRTLEQQFEIDDEATRLWRNEWNRVLYGFYSTIRERFWLNPIQAALLADNKVHQQKIAQQNGFFIPETLISNNKDDLIQFACLHGDVALKFMSQDMYRGDDGGFRGLYVNKISEGDLINFGSRQENPVTLQRYVDKAFEVRYTVVGDKHFVCAIHSQQSQRAKFDWRRYDLPNTPHAAIEAPENVRAMVSALMAHLGLAYGAIDFIVDSAGQWWFLEINTAGQWLWIEDLTGLRISSAIADLLIARSREITE